MILNQTVNWWLLYQRNIIFLFQSYDLVKQLYLLWIKLTSIDRLFLWTGLQFVYRDCFSLPEVIDKQVTRLGCSSHDSCFRWRPCSWVNVAFTRFYCHYRLCLECEKTAWVANPQRHYITTWFSNFYFLLSCYLVSRAFITLIKLWKNENRVLLRDSEGWVYAADFHSFAL